MFEVLFAGQIPKDFDYPELVEDALLFSTNRMSIAISDGASESYDSKKWADLIVEKFSLDSYISSQWISDIQKKYLLGVDYANLSWSKQSSFDRGSFATILGLKEIAKGQLEVTSIGDCECLVFKKDLTLSYAIPYRDSLDFENRPDLISTKFELNDFVKSKNIISVISVDQDDIIFMMSDALACWVLKSIEAKDDRWKKLLEITEINQLSELVICERSNHLMKVDDVTFVMVQSVEDIEYELSHSRAI